MESAKRELPTKKTESKEALHGEFASIMARVGAKHYEAYRESHRETETAQKNYLARVRQEMEVNSAQSKRVPSKQDYLARLKHLAGLWLPQEEVSKAGIDDEISVAEFVVCHESDVGVDTIKEFDTMRELNFLPTLKKLLEAGFILDDDIPTYFSRIKLTADIATDFAKDGVLQKYRELTDSRNIHIIYGIAKSLSLPTPFSTKIALELLELARATEQFRNKIGGKNLTKKELDASMGELMALGLGNARKKYAEMVQTITRQNGTGEGGITNLLILSLLAKDGRIDMTPIYSRIGKNSHIDAIFKMGDKELIDDKYEKLFWKIWDNGSSVRKELRAHFTTPKEKVEEVAKMLNTKPSVFFLVFEKTPEIAEYLTDETDRHFLKILLEIKKIHGFTPFDPLPPEARDSLFDLVEKNGGVDKMARLPLRQILDTANKAPLALRRVLITGIANLQYSADEANYNRDGMGQIADTEGRGRRNRAEAAGDAFSQSLQELAIPQEEIERIINFRNCLSAVGNDQKLSEYKKLIEIDSSTVDAAIDQMRTLPPLDESADRLAARAAMEENVARRLSGAIIWENEDALAENQRNDMELYDIATKEVAPIFIAFADAMPRKLSTSGDNSKMLFFASDSIAAHESAKTLLRRFPERYPGVVDEDLIYANISRRVLENNGESEITSFLMQLGIKSDDKIIVAGFAKSYALMRSLNQAITRYGADILSAEVITSGGVSANSFLFDDGKTLESLCQTPGNPVIHFLEDTFSGTIKSPSRLKWDKETKEWSPEITTSEPYTPRETLKREVALQAVADRAESTTIEELDRGIDRAAIDRFFLEQGTHLKEIGVPHER